MKVIKTKLIFLSFIYAFTNNIIAATSKNKRTLKHLTNLLPLNIKRMKTGIFHEGIGQFSPTFNLDYKQLQSADVFPSPRFCLFPARPSLTVMMPRRWAEEYRAVIINPLASDREKKEDKFSGRTRSVLSFRKFE